MLPEELVLGEEATLEGEVMSEEDSSELSSHSFNLQNFLPHLLIGLGSLFLIIAGGAMLLPKLKKGYNRKRGENQEII
jgi:hypothetical protein